MKTENARTDRAKPIWPSDYSQAGHKKLIALLLFGVYLYGAHILKMAHTNFDCAPSAHETEILQLSLKTDMNSDVRYCHL